LQRFHFGEVDVLEKSQVVVVRSRAVEETAASGSGSAEHVSAEGSGVEIRFAVPWILIDVQWLTVMIGFVDPKIVDAGGLGAEQGIVAEVDKSHRKTRIEVRDAGKFRPGLTRPGIPSV